MISDQSLNCFDLQFCVGQMKTLVKICTVQMLVTSCIGHLNVKCSKPNRVKNSASQSPWVHFVYSIATGDSWPPYRKAKIQNCLSSQKVYISHGFVFFFQFFAFWAELCPLMNEYVEVLTPTISKYEYGGRVWKEVVKLNGAIRVILNPVWLVSS